MATLTFTGSRPTPRQKSVLVVGQVNAEPITVVVDESWSGLQLELQFFNSATHPEVPVVVILDSTMTCKVPPEVTKEVGIVHVALAGRDSGTIIKLSEKLYYADAKIGADPQGGLTPEQQTPNYLAQMVQQATQANQTAQAAQKAAEEAAESVASAGPYAEEAKKAAEAAKASQNAAATSARQANEAAQTAQNAAGSAEEYAKQALASVLPNTTEIPDDYFLSVKNGLPVWVKIFSGVDNWRQIRDITLGQESLGFMFDTDDSGAKFSLRKILIVGVTYSNEAGDSPAYINARFNKTQCCVFATAAGKGESFRGFLGIFCAVAGVMIPIDVKNSSNGTSVSTKLTYNTSYSSGGTVDISPEEPMLVSLPKSPVESIDVISWRTIGKDSRLIVWGVDA